MIRVISAGMLVVLLALPAKGQEGHPLVVLVSMQECCAGKAWLEAEWAARDEFESLNLPVAIVQGKAVGDEDRRLELRRLAEQEGGVCAFRIVRPEGKEGSDVEIWMSERLSGKTVFRLIHTDGRTDAEEARVVGLRTVEALRTSLLEFSLRRPDERVSLRSLDTGAEVPGVENSAKDSLGPLSLRLGGGVVASPGGAGPLGSLQLAARWEPLEVLAVELDGSYSLVGRQIDNQGAEASFDIGMVRSWAFYNILRTGTWRPSVGAGAGILIPVSVGVNLGNNVARLDRTVVGYAGAAAQLGVHLNETFRIRLGVRLGIALPEVEVIFGSEQVASFGMPMFEGFLNVELGVL